MNAEKKRISAAEITHHEHHNGHYFSMLQQIPICNRHITACEGQAEYAEETNASFSNSFLILLQKFTQTMWLWKSGLG